MVVIHPSTISAYVITFPSKKEEGKGEGKGIDKAEHKEKGAEDS